MSWIAITKPQQELKLSLSQMHAFVVISNFIVNHRNGKQRHTRMATLDMLQFYHNFSWASDNCGLIRKSLTVKWK